ncbi:MAG: glycine cleavage system aminomethyltransferase GcvT [Armatimonadota bacterium]
MRRTAIFDLHIGLGARMMEFAGWEMPLHYGSILSEARAVRSGVGVFDVSHMGRLLLRGEDALKVLERETVNNAAGLALGRGHYTLMLNEAGGIVEDLVLFRLDAQEYLLVTNAVNTCRVLERFREHVGAGANVEVMDQTEALGMLALQGPRAVEILRAYTQDRDPGSLMRFGIGWFRVGGVSCLVSRTGYTGEDGFELICEARGLASIWHLLVGDGGAVPCGLGARDVLRIEAGYPLYGHEISDEITPFEAGLGWVLKNTKEYVGKEALRRMGFLAQSEMGQAVLPKRRLMGLLPETRSVPRQGDVVEREGQVVGKVASGTFSPNLNRSLATAFIDTEFAKPGEVLAVRSGNKTQNARVSALPFKRF